MNLSQRLNIVSTELQNEVMKTRMQPIGNILSKFNRVIRDQSKELNKEIQLILEGTETELDKTLIEAVKDPLTHIVRNAIDHGIEMPNERKEKGKYPVGKLSIRSFHEGGQVIIEVSDDGKGLNKKRIGTKAIEKGLISQESFEKMSDREINNLIFLPGFSTAEKISNLSGRGVGMDVVKTNIEKIGGMVDLTTIEGLGTTIRLKIPLTLAIVPALIVKSAKERFAIPQVKLVELVRIEKKKGDNKNGIEFLQAKPVFRLRGNLLPLISLNSVLCLSKDWQELDDLEKEITNIVVLNADTGFFGLIVDSIEDSTDIVVKPLCNFLKSLSVFSGATVMGDGSVALALDVISLSALAHVFDQSATQIHPSLEIHKSKFMNENFAEYIVINIGSQTKHAIPLNCVKRLEEFNSTDIELVGSTRVIRYRGDILQIISIPSQLNLLGYKETQSDKTSVVVVEKDGRLFGLQVNEILDVLNIEGRINSHIKDRASILGSLIHGNEVVVIIDTNKIIELELKNAA